MSGELFSSDERSRAAAAVLDWLSSLRDRREKVLTRDQSLLICCCSLLVHEWTGSSTAQQAAATPTFDLEGCEPPAGSGGDPYLGLVFASLRSRCTGYRDDHRTLLVQAGSVLSAAVSENSVALRRIASLLDLLGARTELGSFRRDLPTIGSLYEMDAEQVRQTCHDLAVATRFGSARSELAEEIRVALELPLSAIALAYLRDYRLDLGCLVVRTLRYLDVGAKAMAQAVPFVLLQQQAAGCFGFVSQPGLLRLRDRQADLDLEVFLPTTFECLWTLAVIDGDDDPVHSPREAAPL
jgi:hypothetical protein